MTDDIAVKRLLNSRLLAALTGALIVLLGFALWYYASVYRGHSEGQSAETFVIASGSSMSRVSADLANAGLIPSARFLNLHARLTGQASAIKPGEYRVMRGQSANELLSRFVEGDVITYRLTLIEGWTFRQALNAIQQSERVTITLASATFPQIASALQLQTDNPEGMLYPDTYFYTAGATDLELLQRAKQRLDEELALAWESRAGALPLEKPYDALILASIIEKESAAGSERPLISSVFTNRLQQGMRLQSDPTVIYGLGDAFQGNLTRDHLEQETPYNTYRIASLPPTPIALAGAESLHAALHPAFTNYFYFVADNTGKHVFSETLEQHNDAVNRYQRTQQQ